MSNIIGIRFCGGFGNQLFQYSFARSYAEAFGHRLATPPWVGQQIFELDDLPLTMDLPPYGFDGIPGGQGNLILQGYFQNGDALSFMTRTKLRDWLRIKDVWLPYYDKVKIAAHLRRGDYVSLSHIYCLVDAESYRLARDEFVPGVTIDWISEENSRQDPDLVRHGIPFLKDFLTLVNADVLFRANSTFSWWAGVFNRNKVYSPLVEGKVGCNIVKFVEGNWPRMVDQANCGSKVSDLHLSE